MARTFVAAAYNEADGKLHGQTRQTADCGPRVQVTRPSSRRDLRHNDKKGRWRIVADADKEEGDLCRGMRQGRWPSRPLLASSFFTLSISPHP
jgi:hypothetical protein